MNAEKLAKLQASVRIGGKGTPRRKVKKVHHAPVTDEKKTQATLQKLGVQPIPGIEEANFFRDDGKILHFKYPKGAPSRGCPRVHPANTLSLFCLFAYSPGFADLARLCHLWLQ